jgi:hypothetical protein
VRSPARPVPGRPSPPGLVRVAPGPGLVPLSPHRRCRGERGQGGEGRSKTPDSRPQRGNDRGRGRGHEPKAARGERPRGTATEATHPEARRDGERDAQLGRHGAEGRPAARLSRWDRAILVAASPFTTFAKARGEHCLPVIRREKSELRSQGDGGLWPDQSLGKFTRMRS